VAERDGPEAGLAALAALPLDSRREAVRSELLARAGRPAEAAAAVSVALGGDAPEAQKRYWRQRLATWQDAVRAAEP
jgi:RNA polymerase sigma-70 factor, ECF subfamily